MSTHRTSIAKFFYSNMFFVVMFAVLALMLLSYARAYYQDIKIKQEIASLEQEVQELEHKKIESLEMLSFVTSDEFVEQQARTVLNMKKPGEQVAFVQTSIGNRRSGYGDSHTGGKRLTNVIQWLRYFFTRE